MTFYFIKKNYICRKYPQKMTLEKQWHVCYTKSRAEKAVAKELEFMGIDHFLPIQKKLRKWSDRKKWVEMPLISGYIFVNIDRKEYDRVLSVNGIVTYVRFERQAAIIPDQQIQQLKDLLAKQEADIKIGSGYKPGDRVEVIAGPLIGTKGNLIDVKGKKQVVINFEQIDMNFAVTVKVEDVTKIKE